MKISYSTKSVYGNDNHYPVSDDAKTICKLTGRKTLTERDIAILTEAGHEVERIKV